MAATNLQAPAGPEAFAGDEIDEGEPDLIESPEVVTTGTEAIDQTDHAGEAPSIAETAPERVTPQLTTAEPDAREEAPPDVPTKAEGEN